MSVTILWHRLWMSDGPMSGVCTIEGIQYYFERCEKSYKAYELTEIEIEEMKEEHIERETKLGKIINHGMDYEPVVGRMRGEKNENGLIEITIKSTNIQRPIERPFVTFGKEDVINLAPSFVYANS